MPAPTVSPGARWYCVECWGGRELQVIVELHALGFTTFLPLYQPAPGAVLEPAFPGYVFVRFDVADPTWIEIRSRPGVIQVLQREAGRPMVVAEHVMAGLVLAYGTGGLQVEAVRRPEWAPLRRGAWVEVLMGPFTGFGAEVVRQEGERVHVAIRMLGRVTEVDLPRTAVGPA